MITVRFPTGVSIDYDDATVISRRDGICDLFDKQGGHLLAQVPTHGAVIEFKPATRVYLATERRKRRKA
jgi:hypothetical protein